MKDFLNSWGISLMVFLPLVGALAMLVVPKAKEQFHKVVALAASLVVGFIGILLMTNFDYDASGSLQYVVDKAWIPIINSRYIVGIDGISLPMIALTLLIVPLVFPDFLDFNDFLDRADRLLRKMRLDGIFQIASFHPQYQFADAAPDDSSHFTNRAPYPILHLLREDSIDRAVVAFPDAALIYERNVETLRALGPAGWKALNVGPAPDVPAPGAGRNTAP